VLPQEKGSAFLNALPFCIFTYPCTYGLSRAYGNPSAIAPYFRPSSEACLLLVLFERIELRVEP
jgi:hypothetical protein